MAMLKEWQFEKLVDGIEEIDNAIEQLKQAEFVNDEAAAAGGGGKNADCDGADGGGGQRRDRGLWALRMASLLLTAFKGPADEARAAFVASMPAIKPGAILELATGRFSRILNEAGTN